MSDLISRLLKLCEFDPDIDARPDSENDINYTYHKRVRPIIERLIEELEIAKHEITGLKNQLSITNSNWPHEKKLHEEIERLKIANDSIRQSYLNSSESVRDLSDRVVALDTKIKLLTAERDNLLTIYAERGREIVTLRDQLSFANSRPHEKPHEELEKAKALLQEIARAVAFDGGEYVAIPKAKISAILKRQI